MPSSINVLPKPVEFPTAAGEMPQAPNNASTSTTDTVAWGTSPGCQAAPQLAEFHSVETAVSVERAAPEQMESRAPTLASIEAIPTEMRGRLDPSLVMLTAPDSRQAEAYRLLRHRLVQANGPRVVVVTSAQPGEGKTTCAANLALALAEAKGARVLLLEANTDAPRLAQLLQISDPCCLLSQITQHAKHFWAVHELLQLNLHASVIFPPNARGKHLQGNIVAQLMATLRHFYDYIVVDTPAVLTSAEANLMSGMCDGVILTARAKRSREGAIRQAIKQLEPAPILGVTLLDAPDTRR